MVAAADAGSLNQTELERCAAVRTVQFQEADRAVLAAESDQVFAENPQAARHLAEFFRRYDRVPETAEIFTARGPGSDAGQFVVRQRLLAVVVGAESLVQKGRSLDHGFPPIRRFLRGSTIYASCAGSSR